MPTEPASLPAIPDAVGVLLPFLSAPLAVLTAVVVWLRLRRPPDEQAIIAALDRVLAEDRDALRAPRRGHPLRFRTSERIPVAGVGWGLRPGRVEIVRTICAATGAGYRLRLRAFARGSHGRTIVRSVEVDVRAER